MAAQLSQILDRSALPNVTVQVLPYDAGAHPAVESNFTILELPDPTPGVVFAEGLIGFTYLKRDEDLARYEMIFRELQSIALSPKGSLDLIRKLLQHYKGSLESSTRTFFAPGCRPARRKNCGGPVADVNRGSVTQIKGARCHRRSWRLVTSGGEPPGAARATGRAWRSLPHADRFSSATQRIRMVLFCRTRRARGARSLRRPRMVSSTWSAYSLVVV